MHTFAHNHTHAHIRPHTWKHKLSQRTVKLKTNEEHVAKPEA